MAASLARTRTHQTQWSCSMHAFVHLHAQSHLHSLARRTQAQTRMAYIRSYWRKRTSCRQQWMPRKLHASSRPKNSWHAAKRPFAFATPSPAFSPALPLFLPPSPSPASSLCSPILSIRLCLRLFQFFCAHTHAWCVRANRCSVARAMAHRQTHTHTSRKQQGKADLGSEEWVDAQPFWEVINRREFVDQCQRQLNVIQQDLAGTSGPAWENLQVI
jgi:hypothetical protein